MKRWIKRELRGVAKKTGADVKYLKRGFLRLRDAVIESYGEEGASAKALALLIEAIETERQERVREAKVERAERQPAARYTAVAEPDEVDELIAIARDDSPDLEVVNVSTGLIRKGPDAGRVIVAIAMNPKPAPDPKELPN